MTFVHDATKYVKHLYQETEEAYQQPLVVNLENEFSRYSFIKHHPEKEEAIDQLFRKTIAKSDDQLITVGSLLQTSEFKAEDLILLEKIGFRQLSNNPKTGVVLEHEELKGWLIKKNYGHVRVGTELKRIAKVVSASDFPWWMLPATMRHHSKTTPVGIKVPNDIINPLRVVMLKRARQWIKRLNLTQVKAVKEYLYRLPDTAKDQAQPLHQNFVVISKKANIVSEEENLQRFVTMAYHRPKKLEELVQKISLVIKYMPLTDACLRNIRFLDDDTDTLTFFDGEPIGGLTDISQPQMIKGIQEYDRGFFSLLGLKKLTASIREQMEGNFSEAKIAKVQEIFDRVTLPIKNTIIYERGAYLIKTQLGRYYQFNGYILAILVLSNLLFLFFA